MNGTVRRFRLKSGMQKLACVAVCLIAAVWLAPQGLSAQEPYLVKEIFPNANASPGEFTWFKGRVFFGAQAPGTGNELWTTDGTEAGTALFKDLNGGNIGGDPSMLTVVGDVMLFRIVQGIQFRPELGITDGTPEGTFIIDDINPAEGHGSSPHFLTRFDDLVYFRALIGNADNSHAELWRSDGTAEGTFRFPLPEDGTLFDPSSLTVAGNHIYLAADETAEEFPALWRTDGTPEGTEEIGSDSFEGPILPVIEEMAVLGDRVFFSAIESFDTVDLELWTSDGTPSGTFLIKDINPNGFSEPESLTTVGDVVIFTAVDGDDDRELWKTDGTEPGTVRVRNINTVGSSDPEELFALGSLIYFSAEDDSGDRELWRSDGTEEGTYRVRDIDPGGSSGPAEFESVGPLLFFAATLEGDRELWRSDGTEVGTYRLREILEGGSSNPTELTNIRGRLYFGAANETGLGGRNQLYALDVATPHVANLSTRGFVGTGASVMIAGIIIEDGPKEVIIRAIGPGLDAFGVPNTLGDPTLTLFSGATQIAFNDDWRETQETEIEATGLPPGFDAESAIVLELEAGAYTAIVSGGIGHALVELFELH